MNTEVIREIKGRMAEVQAQLAPLNREMANLQIRMAEAKAPCKAGDVVEWSGGDYKGKVLEVLSTRYGDYNLKVLRIRKDGTYGATVFLSSYHNLKLASA